ncbi:MAG: hypothetical protein IPK60_18350 [Sandaracinaceae bacterium]|jgi:hypothetical protein|nr:hypothetical protein [Sandaracinaceae bacterium]
MRVRHDLLGLIRSLVETLIGADQAVDTSEPVAEIREPSSDSLGILITHVDGTTTSAGVLIPWNDLKELSAVEPWPNLRIVTPSMRQLLLPASPLQPDSYAHSVDALFQNARQFTRGNVRMDQAWLRHAEVNAEVVPEWPTTNAATYREAEAPERVLAERDPARFLASKPDALPPYALRRAFIARRAMLTSAALYFNTDSAAIYRLPVDKLRNARHVSATECVFTFGRRTFIRLSEPTKCPVAKAMLTRLKRRA